MFQKIDGVELRQLDLSWWRSQLGVIQESPDFTTDSVKDNITYGDPRQDIDLAEVIAAATEADVHESILSLPKVRPCGVCVCVCVCVYV